MSANFSKSTIIDTLQKTFDIKEFSDPKKDIEESLKAL